MKDLKMEVWQIIRETDGYNDALHYVSEIAEDLQAEGQEVSADDVTLELRRQLGMPDDEQPEELK